MSTSIPDNTKYHDIVKMHMRMCDWWWRIAGRSPQSATTNHTSLQGFPILSFLANRKRFARRGRGAGAGRCATRASTSSPASVASPRESDQTNKENGKALHTLATRYTLADGLWYDFHVCIASNFVWGRRLTAIACPMRIAKK